MSFFVGVVLFVASLVALWLALPQGGEVRNYLRNDQVQAYSAVAILGAFVMGLLYTVLGLVSLLS